MNLAAESQTIEAIKFHTSPTIDGKLDDECWQRVTGVDAFKIAELETTVPDRTEVFLGFDDEALYVSFRCVQKEASIIANQTRRDGSFQLWGPCCRISWYTSWPPSLLLLCCESTWYTTGRETRVTWVGMAKWFAAAIVELSVWTVEMKNPLWGCLICLSLPNRPGGLTSCARHQSLDRTSIWADTGVNVFWRESIRDVDEPWIQSQGYWKKTPAWRVPVCQIWRCFLHLKTYLNV